MKTTKLLFPNSSLCLGKVLNCKDCFPADCVCGLVFNSAAVALLVTLSYKVRFKYLPIRARLWDSYL